MSKKSIAYCLIISLIPVFVFSQSRPDTTFKVFQFPADRIPRIDGETSDWDIVPEHYVIGTDQLVNSNNNQAPADLSTLDVKVKVGWVDGLNRLYFLYEAYDNYWYFNEAGLKNDTFEVVVDGDLSGGPFIDRFHPNERVNIWDAYFSFHGVHAQNYHIFTPAVDKDWTMAWGPQSWIKKLPYANAATVYNFSHGESGNLSLEFWITPFDYASAEDPEYSVQSHLYEGKKIGLSWAILDYDEGGEQTGFWNLSRERSMYGDASELVMFELMPFETQFQKKMDANWTFKIVDMERRMVAFIDESIGNITSWEWDFGDGSTSNKQHPVHKYQKAGLYVVVLKVRGPDGTSSFSRVWDVAIK